MPTRTLLAAALLTLSAARAADRPPPLDEALRQTAPKVLDHLRGKRYQTVGVLKFLARQGDGPWTDNLGTFNRALADRLEVALVLALPDDSPLTLITRASDAVAESGNVRATHRTERGRREFFRINPRLFRPAWGTANEVRPDAFLTGEAVLAADLKTLRVTIQAFGADAPEELTTVCAFTAAVDPRTLTETGASYVRRRGARDDDEDEAPRQVVATPLAKAPPASAAAFEEERKEREPSFAALLEKAPVRLEVLYNGKPVPLTGGAVPTPRPGDRVAFRVTNTGSETCGVVLKVNGKSTIFYEELPALQCYKWILEPGKSVTVEGFQKDDGRFDRFEVKSPAEAREHEVYYGEHAGTFSVVVFRGTTKADEAVVKREESRPAELKAISRGSLGAPGARPADLRALKARLTAGQPATGSRGMIVKGAEGAGAVERVEFTPYPRELLSVTIRYYQPPQ